jgi:broad-specificity NMP kinase
MQEYVMQQTSNTLVQIMPNIIDIIIIRGAPGSGKSHTAKSLSKYYPKGVRLEVDSIRQMVISVDWTNQQEHIDMLQASTKLVYEFLNLDLTPVIIIDTFSGDKLNRFIKTLNQLDNNLNIKIFALITTSEELERRLNTRKDNQFKDFVISKKINDDVLKFAFNDEQIIDTTGLSSIETANIIFNKISLG